MTLKRGIRVLGIDDCPCDKFKDRHVTVIGVSFRGGEYVEGVVSTKIRVDGTDATSKLAELISKTRFRPQLRCVFIDGLNMAGFNFIDIHRLHEKTGLPIIVVTRKDPDISNIKRVLKKLGMEKKIRLMDKAGPPKMLGKIHIQFAGTTFEKAAEFIRLTATRSYLPEPIRVAHLIGAGLVKGESKGNA